MLVVGEFIYAALKTGTVCLGASELCKIKIVNEQTQPTLVVISLLTITGLENDCFLNAHCTCSEASIITVTYSRAAPW